jgi:hypothetical protein
MAERLSQANYPSRLRRAAPAKNTQTQADKKENTVPVSIQNSCMVGKSTDGAIKLKLGGYSFHENPLTS